MDNVEDSDGLTEEIISIERANKENSMQSTELDQTSKEVSLRKSFKDKLDGQDTVPNKPVTKRKMSLLNKLRHSFYEYRPKLNVDESCAYREGSKNGEKSPPESGRNIEDPATSVQHWSSESGFDLDSSDLADGEKLSNSQASLKSQCDGIKPKGVSNPNKGNEDAIKAHLNIHNKWQSSCLSLFDIIQHSKLVAVTLQRKPEDEWGVKLSQGNRADSRSQNETEIQEDNTLDNAFHNSGLKRSTIPPETSASPSAKYSDSRKRYEPGNSVVGLRKNLLKRSVKRKLGRMKVSISSTRTTERSSLRRPGMYIAGMTKGGVADRCGELAVEDLIIEVRSNMIMRGIS